jgi:hypothetical protein
MFILRHIGDVGQFVTICVSLFSVFTYLVPLIGRVKECTSEKSRSLENCEIQARGLKAMQGYLLVLNILMLVWDIIRFSGNSKEEHRPQAPREIPKHL